MLHINACFTSVNAPSLAEYGGDRPVYPGMTWCALLARSQDFMTFEELLAIVANERGEQ